jgi:alkylhydroperoxidase family enzyme
MSQGDVDVLRAAGFTDSAIHDASQVVSYFNYINRIADALGVELETFVRAWGDG